MKSPKISTARTTRWSDIDLRGVAVELQLDGIPVLRFTQEGGLGTMQIEIYPNIGPVPLAVSHTAFAAAMQDAQLTLDNTPLDPLVDNDD